MFAEIRIEPGAGLEAYGRIGREPGPPVLEKDEGLDVGGSDMAARLRRN